MLIKIKTFEGYTIHYDDRLRRFILQDTDNTELAQAKTQEEIEGKAKQLRKQEFKRIPIFLIQSQGQVTTGELTSINRDDKSAWISMEKGENTWGSGRQKINLRYQNGYYEATPANLKVTETIKAKREIITRAIDEIGELIKTLEKPIGSKYFGMEER